MKRLCPAEPPTSLVAYELEPGRVIGRLNAAELEPVRAPTGHGSRARGRAHDGRRRRRMRETTNATPSMSVAEPAIRPRRSGAMLAVDGDSSRAK